MRNRLARLAIVGLFVVLHPSWVFASDLWTFPVDSCDDCTPSVECGELLDGCWSEPVCRLLDPNATSLLGDDNLLDNTFDSVLGVRDRFHVPVGFGAWHWLHTDLAGTNGSGYGSPGLRGTYFWWVSATPEYELRDGLSVGGHTEFRLRDSGDGFRSFFTHTKWFYEA